jgi:nucleotide-binding universal stress UspA family protein
MSDDTLLVVCYDGSDEAKLALHEAARLFPGGRVKVIHVWQSIQSSTAFRYSAAGITGALNEAMDELEASGREAATKIVEEGVRLATELGLSADGVVERATDHVWSPVVEFLDREQAAVAVVGSRRLGAIKAGVLGGFSGGLVHHSRRPVLIVPRQ